MALAPFAKPTSAPSSVTKIATEPNLHADRQQESGVHILAAIDGRDFWRPNELLTGIVFKRPDPPELHRFCREGIQRTEPPFRSPP